MDTKSSFHLRRLACVAIAVVFCAVGGSAIAAITPEETAMMRLMQLSETPGQASVDEVLTLAAEGSTFPMRHQFIFVALTRLGPATSADNYAKSVLDAGTGSSELLRGALAYLTEHAQRAWGSYAATYLDATQPGEVRAMAAYLAGMLGLTAHKDTIISIVSNAAYGDWRLHAAMGLAYLQPVNEFTTTLNAAALNGEDTRLVTSYNAFLQASDTDKEAMLSSLLGRGEIPLQLIAMRYLLQQNKVDLLKNSGVVTGDAITVSFSTKPYQAIARILGYQVSGNIDAVSISRSTLR